MQTRHERVQILDEARTRHRYELLYLQNSSIPVQVVKWPVHADLVPPRSGYHEVFDLSEAMARDGFDEREYPVPFEFARVNSRGEAEGVFYIPLRFGSRPSGTLHFRYDDLGSYPKLSEIAEYYTGVAPRSSLKRLTVSIEGLGEMRVELPVFEHFVWVEGIEDGLYDEAESTRASACLTKRDNSLYFDIPDPKAGFNYKFSFRAERDPSPSPPATSAAATFLHDLPELLAHRRRRPLDKWAAYHGAVRIGIAASRQLLRELCAERRLPPDEIRIFGIDAAAATNPIDVTL